MTAPGNSITGKIRTESLSNRSKRWLSECKGPQKFSATAQPLWLKGFQIPDAGSAKLRSALDMNAMDS